MNTKQKKAHQAALRHGQKFMEAKKKRLRAESEERQRLATIEKQRQIEERQFSEPLWRDYCSEITANLNLIKDTPKSALIDAW